jgi:hypothetical protein
MALPVYGLTEIAKNDSSWLILTLGLIAMHE